MESSRRDLLNDRAEHRPILKNNQNTYHHHFGFPPKTGEAFPKTGFCFHCVLSWYLKRNNIPADSKEKKFFCTNTILKHLLIKPIGIKNNPLNCLDELFTVFLSSSLRHELEKQGQRSWQHKQYQEIP